MVQFTAITILFLALIVTCYSRCVLKEWKSSNFRSSPISVHMKCFNGLVNVHCHFYFTNNDENDYYLLKRNTPLERLRSNFLQVTHNQRIIKYEGRFYNRLPAKRDEFILIPAGDTVTSPSIAINRAYKFPHDGQYTIHYTGPLVYVSRNNMATLQESELPQGSHAPRQISATTEIVLNNVYRFQELDKEREAMQRKYANEYRQDYSVHFSAGCPDPTFDAQIKKETQIEVKPLHVQMCDANGLPKSIDLVKTKGQSSAQYTLWFGKGDTSKVENSLQLMLNGLKKATDYAKGKVGEEYCDPETSAYSYDNTNTVYLCDLFNEQPDTSSVSGAYTKRQIIAHEWSHAFACTDDEEYGDDYAKELAKQYPERAVKTAENYGYFYQDVYNM